MLSRRLLLTTVLATPFVARAQVRMATPGAAAPTPQYLPGSVAVGRKPGVAAADPRIAQVVAKHHASVGLDIPPIAVTDWRVMPGDEAAFIADMLATGVIKFAELNAVSAAPPSFSVPPNDTNYSSQWPITQMNVPAAWTALGSYGNPGIVISDLNTGNSAASPEAPVNTLAGWNVVSSTNNTADIDLTCNSPSIPGGGHGTTTESTIFANTNNGAVISGVASTCTLQSVVVYACTGIGGGTVATTTQTQIAAGITWAAGNGGKIISMDCVVLSVPSAAVNTALQFSVAAGCLNVGATNDGNPSGTPYSGASSPGQAQLVLAAVPVNGDNSVASFSGGGNYVALATPGGTSAAFSGVGIPGVGADGAYDSNFQGVSFAIPLLAGVAGLVGSAQLASSQGRFNANDVAATLMATATHIGGQAGWTSFLGVGLVNAGAAVTAALHGRLPNNQTGLLGVG